MTTIPGWRKRSPDKWFMHYMPIVMDINRIKIALPRSVVCLIIAIIPPVAPFGPCPQLRLKFTPAASQTGLKTKAALFAVCQPWAELFGWRFFFFYFFLTRNFNIFPSAQAPNKKRARKKARQILTRGYSLNSPLLICFPFACCHSVSFH